MSAAVLDETIAHLERAIPYTPANYPKLAELEGEDAFEFAISHAMRHQSKSLGDVNAMLEAYDHGNDDALKREALRSRFVKMIANVLRLCPLVDMDGEEVLRRIREDFPPRD